MTHYRADIDGLRAVAVLSVLFFHAGFPAFGGGFVGVDIFFVISGYLITQILIKSIDAGNFSIADFYKRRALRILPAYTAMCLASATIAIWLLPPGPLIDFSESLLSSALFVANFYFAGQMNYFQSAAEELPLLHMWSLSVEEQFYVIWPFAILMLSMLPSPRLRLFLVGAGTLGGAIFCEWAIRNKSQTMVFFYTPFRAWELMIGALAAMSPVLKMNMRSSTVLSTSGVLLILGAVLFFEPRRPPFPGISALLPCLGAVLIIITGTFQSTVVHRLLSQRHIVLIGLLSYSLYLWHWPLFAFMRYLNQGQLGLVLACVLCVMSLGLAYLSWRFIETPFRKTKGRGSYFGNFGTPSVLGASVLTILLTAITAAALFYTNGLPSRASALALTASEALDSQHSLTEKCLRERSPENSLLNLKGCVFGDLSKKPVAALWGDSHANAILPAFEKQFSGKSASFELLAMRSCTPIIGEEFEPDYTGRAARACHAFRDLVAEYLAKSKEIDVIYVSSYWSATLNRLRDLESERSSARSGADLDVNLDPEEIFKEMVKRRIVAPLREVEKKVVLIGQPPHFEHGGGRCLARKAFLNEPLSDCDQSLAEYMASVGKVNGLLREIEGASFIDLEQIFCDSLKCSPYPENTFAFRDEHHLSVSGALLLAQLNLNIPLEPTVSIDAR